MECTGRGGSGTSSSLSSDAADRSAASAPSAPVLAWKLCCAALTLHLAEAPDPGSTLRLMEQMFKLRSRISDQQPSFPSGDGTVGDKEQAQGTGDKEPPSWLGEL